MMRGKSRAIRIPKALELLVQLSSLDVYHFLSQVMPIVAFNTQYYKKTKSIDVKS